MSSSPPDGLSVRQATVGDASAVDELITAADVDVQGWSESSVPELLGWWRMMDLQHDSWLLHEDDALVGYAAGFAHGEAFELDGFVHPKQRGRGFGAWLVGRGEVRARELGKRKLQAFCSGAGVVGALGVRKPWRRRGIAQALLHHAFGEFYRRGKRRVALGVDAENPTGATRLYERAGMHVAFEAVTYGKELAA